MQITLDLEENLVKNLERTAAASGESPSRYVSLALQERLASRSNAAPLSLEERARRIDQGLAKLRASGANLGRSGKPWREFIHEGHDR